MGIVGDRADVVLDVFHGSAFTLSSRRALLCRRGEGGDKPEWHREDQNAGRIFRRPISSGVWLDETAVADKTVYPFCLPLFVKGFELEFGDAITIIVGENGTGKSTLLEGIAELAGFARDGGTGTTRLGQSATPSKVAATGSPRHLRGAGFRKSASAGSSVRELLRHSALLGSRGEGGSVRAAAAGLPLSFARRRLLALLPGALPEARAFHLRRTGVRALALAPVEFPETSARDGRVEPSARC